MLGAAVLDIYADISINLTKCLDIAATLQDMDFDLSDVAKIFDIVVQHLHTANDAIEFFSEERNNDGWYSPFRHEMAVVLGNLYGAVHLLANLYYWNNATIPNSVWEMLRYTQALKSSLDNLKQIVDNAKEIK